MTEHTETVGSNGTERAVKARWRHNYKATKRYAILEALLRIGKPADYQTIAKVAGVNPNSASSTLSSAGQVGVCENVSPQTQRAKWKLLTSNLKHACEIISDHECQQGKELKRIKAEQRKAAVARNMQPTPEQVDGMGPALSQCARPHTGDTEAPQCPRCWQAMAIIEITSPDGQKLVLDDTDARHLVQLLQHFIDGVD